MQNIRSAEASDFDQILKLNDAEVQQTSPMNMSRLQTLVKLSCYCKVAMADDQVAAFLIAMRENAPYQNDNYEWFAARFPTFLYVDRIVVDAKFSGRRIGSELYEDLFAFAKVHDIEVITCEYNIKPPNPASRAFHDKFGFKELGTQWVAGGSKQVSLQTVQTR